MMASTGAGIPLTRSLGGCGRPGYVAVDPLHRIGGRERQRAGQHLVEA